MASRTIGPWFWALIGVIVLVIVVWLVWEATSGEEEPTVFTIRADPSAYLGEDVTIGGEINQVLADGAFSMGLTATDDEGLLILVPEGAQGESEAPGEFFYQEGDLVEVSGEVVLFSEDSLEELGLDPDDEILGDGVLGDFDSEPAIIADRVDLTDRPE